MKYFDYFIKCVIRRIVRVVFNPFTIFAFLFILVIYFLAFSNYTFAAENIYSLYDDIAGDFINRLSTYSGTDNLMSYLTDSYYNYFLYYGPETNGSSMTTNNYNTQSLFIAFIPNDATLSSFPTDSWAGFSEQHLMTAYNSNSNGGSMLTVFSLSSSNNRVYQYGISYLAIAEPLLYTKPSVITSYLQDLKNTQQITDAIEQSSEQINDTLTNTEYNDDVINIDTSSANIDDSSSVNLFNAIFTNLKNLLDNANWNTVDKISIPVPHSNKTIDLTSDILSKIVGDSFISVLINTAWYSIFGLYVFKFSTKIFQAIKSGDILNGLNLSDEVITSSMM